MKTAKDRNRHKRLFGWILVYLLLLVIFVIVIFQQSGKVNTLDFANGQITLSVSKLHYTVGEKVDYTIKNNLNVAVVLVNHCPKEPLHVYKWENNQWVRIHDSAKSTVCANVQKKVNIPANGSYSGNYANWPALFNKPGIYRIVAFADNYQGLPYADFIVSGKSVPAPAPRIIYQPVYVPVYTGGGDSGGGGGGDN